MIVDAPNSTNDIINTVGKIFNETNPITPE